MSEKVHLILLRPTAGMRCDRLRPAPKRDKKLYLVTVSRSRSGSWRSARREASWRVVDERGDHQSVSPWRVGAQERLKPSYDCDLVVDDVEGCLHAVGHCPIV